MATEARRQLFRIAPNYARLGATLLIGIVLTQLQLAWLGSDAFGLIALLGATLGIGSLFQDLTRQSLIREMGAAYRRSDDEFREAYTSAYVICVAAALLATITFAAIVVVIPLLKISPPLVNPARILVMGEGVAVILTILLAPALNMYVVAERFVAYNLYITLRRANYLIAASLLYFVFDVTDPALGVTLFGVAPAALNITLLIAFVLAAIARDRRLLPRPRCITRGSLRNITATFGWNSGVVITINLHERLAALIMNVAFGLSGNTIFGLALRLVSYIRMGTMGMTFGVDAVSARIASEENSQRMRRLIQHSTRLHALAAIPGAIMVWWLAEPILTLWVGRFLDDPSRYIPQTVVLVRIMMVGLAGRAISDGWLRILYGAGHVKRYAPFILLGALTNPILTVILLLTLPDSTRYTAVGWGYTAVFAIVHFGFLPMIGARALELRFKDFMLPILRPALCAALAFPALAALSMAAQSGGWTLLWLAGAGIGYGALYGALAVVIILRPAERNRMIYALRRSLGV